MSGPATTADTAAEAESSVAAASVIEVTESRISHVGEFQVRRALPRRTRRMVGPWCFVDHMGPATADERGLGVARTRDEITAAHRDWSAGAERFGHVYSQLDRYEVGPPPWSSR